MPDHQAIVLTPPAATGSGWLPAVRGALVLMLLCGGLYPLVAVSLGALLFPHQATGSLIEHDGKVVGSALVGQPFAAPGYFQGRPSAAGHDPFAVAGSNLASSNPALRERAQGTSQAIAAANDVPPERIPVDLVAASGSGIDPHISPDGAALQIGRVAAARRLSEGTVADLVRQHTETPTWGILGQPRVNVLQLNLALDALRAQPAGR
jgi:K+-transporting ATPase ATPase C chain